MREEEGERTPKTDTVFLDPPPKGSRGAAPASLEGVRISETSYGGGDRRPGLNRAREARARCATAKLDRKKMLGAEE